MENYFAICFSTAGRWCKARCISLYVKHCSIAIKEGDSEAAFVTFDFCLILSTSTHIWTSSTDEVSWPQGDLLTFDFDFQFLGGGLRHTGPWPSSPMTDESQRGLTSTT